MFKVGERVKILKNNGHPSFNINKSYIIRDVEKKAWWNTPIGVYYILQDIDNHQSLCEILEDYVVLDKVFYRKEKIEKICSKLEM